MYMYIYIGRERERDKQNIAKCREMCPFCENPVCPHPVRKLSRCLLAGSFRTCSNCEVLQGMFPWRTTPSSQSKIRVFSDPTLGKSQRRRPTTDQKHVSGQPNPWNKSWTANSCYANWV